MTFLKRGSSQRASICPRMRASPVFHCRPPGWLNAPMRVRGALVLMLGFVVHGASRSELVPPAFLEFSWVLVTEFMLGIAMGLVVRFVVAMAEVAAEAIAPMLGLGVAHISMHRLTVRKMC